VSHPKVYFWDCRRSLPFDDDSVEVIFAEHVFEHFEYKIESLKFLTECYRCLKKGGVMRIVVPDAGRYLSLYDSPWECLVPVRPFIKVDDGYRDVWLNTTYKTKMEFINAVFRQGIEHKFAYDFETLDLHLREAGFEKVQLQDYGRSASPHPPLDSALRRTESLYASRSNRCTSCSFLISAPCSGGISFFGSRSRSVSGPMSSTIKSLSQSSSSEVEGFFLMPGTSRIS
jgi:predicted SAM-dependent methyltransferase